MDIDDAIPFLTGGDDIKFNDEVRSTGPEWFTMATFLLTSAIIFLFFRKRCNKTDDHENDYGRA